MTFLLRLLVAYLFRVGGWNLFRDVMTTFLRVARALLLLTGLLVLYSRGHRIIICLHCIASASAFRRRSMFCKVAALNSQVNFIQKVLQSGLGAFLMVAVTDVVATFLIVSGANLTHPHIEPFI